MARVEVPIEVREPDGDPIQDAVITLTIRGGGAATHWSLETGGVSSTGTYNTDANGRNRRWVDPGAYTIQVAKGGLTTVTRAFDAIRGDAIDAIADDTVDTAQLADQSIIAAKLVTNVITISEVADLAVTETKLATDAVSTRTIAPLAVTNEKIADDAVTAAKIQANAVTSAEVRSDAVGASAVGQNELADNSVTESELAALSISTDKIVDGVLEYEKFAAGAIDGTHLSEEIQPEKVADEVLPVGMILPFGGSYQPSGPWRIANGDVVSRTTYAALFSAIGTAFNVGGEAGTDFRLPDLRGRAPVGVGTVALADDEGISLANVGYRQPYHGHTSSYDAAAETAHVHAYSYAVLPYGEVAAGACCDQHVTGYTVQSTYGGGAHSHGIGGFVGDRPGGLSPTNAVPFVVVNYIIKVS